MLEAFCWLAAMDKIMTINHLHNRVMMLVNVCTLQYVYEETKLIVQRKGSELVIY